MGPRWGLCCQFFDSSVRFRQATHRYVWGLPAADRERYLGDIARANAIALAHAIERCDELGIRAFRISSQILPLATHPLSGYTMDSLYDGAVVSRSFEAAGSLAAARDIRLSFHPDQFVVLNSARESVVRASIQEIEFQTRLARMVGVDAITLHVGGATGGKEPALDRLERGLALLSEHARSLLALENDDRLFTVRDLYPVCQRTGVPLVYDVHHHRCNPDGLSVAEATELAASTWGNREPWMHVASPRDGWGAVNPRPHADYVDPADFPVEWLDMSITIDVEAKAKEAAIVRLRDSLEMPIPS